MMPAELIIRVSTVAIMNGLGGLGMFDLFCVLGWGVWELAPQCVVYLAGATVIRFCRERWLP